MRVSATIKRAVVCLSLLGVANAVHAAVLVDLYNTGVSDDAVPVVLPDGTVGDPHYSLLTIPTSDPLGTYDIRVRTSAGGYPISPNGPYLGDNGLSAWIGPNNDAELNSYPGDYYFKTTFDLTGFDPATASITGRWSSDNDGVGIFLNNTLVVGATDFAQFALGFASFTISSGFTTGLNELVFVVHNGGYGPGNSDPEAYGNNPTALRVEMTGVAYVPEASSFLVVGLGGIFAFGVIGLGKRYGISAKL